MTENDTESVVGQINAGSGQLVRETWDIVAAVAAERERIAGELLERANGYTAQAACATGERESLYTKAHVLREEAARLRGAR